MELWSQKDQRVKEEHGVSEEAYQHEDHGTPHTEVTSAGGKPREENRVHKRIGSHGEPQVI